MNLKLDVLDIHSYLVGTSIVSMCYRGVSYSRCGLGFYSLKSNVENDYDGLYRV